jgi:hypothetical protein
MAKDTVALLFHKTPVPNQWYGTDQPKLAQVTLAALTRRVWYLDAQGVAQEREQVVGGSQSLYWRRETGILAHAARSALECARIHLTPWATQAAGRTALAVRDFVFVELADRAEYWSLAEQVEGPRDGSDPDSILGRKRAADNSRIDLLRSTLAGMLYAEGAVPAGRKFLTVADDPAQRRREYKALKFLFDRDAGNVFVDD